MQIHRQASRRSGAESLTVVPECVPELSAGPGGSLVLAAPDSVAPRDDGSRYVYTVVLSAGDIARIRAHLATHEDAEPVAAADPAPRAGPGS